MKAVVCRAPGELVIEDRPEPGSPPPGWALVEVGHVGICGTDYHIFEGKHPFLAYPRVMGHEVSGTVAAAGEGTTLVAGETVIVNPYLSCGRCVACRQGKPNCCVEIEVLGVHRDGAMCERILVPEKNLYPADGLAPADAAAVEFLAIGAHAVRRSGAERGNALVIGAGPIGLGTAVFARIAGVEVSLLDTSAGRLSFAERELGFPALDGQGDVAAQVSAATGGDGFDVVFDATGNAASMQAAFAHVAHGGTLVLVSVVKEEVAFSDPEFHKREMTLVGSRNALAEDFAHVAASMRAGKVPLSKLVTRRTTLADAPRDLARWAHEKTGLVKALIEVG